MKKGYLETVAENHFKTLEDGTRVFYAQGPLGRRGFAVPTPELESDLKRATRTYYLWFIISCGLIGVLVGPLSRGIDLYASILQIVFATVIAYVITCSYFRRYTKSLEAVAGSPNSTLEHWRLDILVTVRKLR